MGDSSKIFGISVRAFIALLITLFVCAMSGIGMKVEEPMYSAFLLTLGFFFGQKSNQIQGAQNENVK